MTAIGVRGLRKSYGSFEAVCGVDLEIADGEVYGLLGHNGAGKSTIIEILEGLRGRDAGTITVLGVDPGHADRAFRDRIGIVLQSSGIEGEFSVAETVALYGSAYRRRRPVDEVLDLVGLSDEVGVRVGALSGGQRRRLDLALGIVGYPELLFLDEPTTGFDPAARRASWATISDLCREGTTVLLTTHYLDEAEQLADRVGVLANGRLVAEGRPDELIGGRGDTLVSFELVGADAADLVDLLPAGTKVAGQRVEFAASEPTGQLHAVTGWAVARNAQLAGLTVKRPTLEDVFLALADGAAGDHRAGQEGEEP